MEISLSQEAEEYIEIIYKLQKRNNAAKTKDLAEVLHVVPGSVTNTIEHLESHGLVRHEPYRGVKLTKEGERLALSIIRRHRLAERFLTDILKADWSTVHADACKLEHAMSKNVTDLLEERLEHPRFCPHGNPIPTETGLIEDMPALALTEANSNESYLVDRIVNEENVNLEMLEDKGIKPQASIQILKQDEKHVAVRVNGKRQDLSRVAADCVLLRKNGRGDYAVKA
jgi:DtxR family transcriptional regulator, Mn-dependent transcriptional regulator